MLEDYYNNYQSDRSNLLLRRLYINIENARLYSTRYLLDNTNFKLAGKSGRFALYLVVKISEVQRRARNILFKWLLQAGCDYNEIDENGLNVLLWLLDECQLTLVKVLLKEYKMDVDYTLTDRNNNSSMMYAVRTKNLEIVTMLSDIYLQFGIDFDVRNKDGFTPYTEAVKLNLKEIADVLVCTGKISLHVSATPCEGIPQTQDIGNFSQMRINMSRGKQLRNLNEALKIQKAYISNKKNTKKYFSIDVDNNNESMKVYANYTHPRKLDYTNYVNSHPCTMVEYKYDTTTGEKDTENTNDTNTKTIIESEPLKTEKRRRKKVCFADCSYTLPEMDPHDTDGRISRMGQVNETMKNTDCYDQPIVSVETLGNLPPTKPSSNITYKDVHEMIPQKYAIGSKAPSVDELKWLLVLQADQRSATYIKKCPRIISQPVKVMKKRESKRSLLNRPRSDISEYR